ncbi:hypothetical protein Pst134EA_024449 [Puccinia striiformis f. sp. tritici]|uniref:hypothetical protein n=1 Tax=Puccinia striiformis f. sp. tritici TaxID=168172 RepID=UPI00200819F2|nr:hypothetical protein Pst134EA_024449 [Puccinia striiformis f. sp. tritici]KAH9453581.1 hypothetical protein Pst134EA_024449 [Puccinia striiformis f. sp. tritici]
MNSRVAMISKALILVFSASLASDVYATTFKCDAGQTETCQYGSNNSIVRLRNHTFYCSGDGEPACCASIAVSPTFTRVITRRLWKVRLHLPNPLRATTNAMQPNHTSSEGLSTSRNLTYAGRRLCSNQAAIL